MSAPSWLERHLTIACTIYVRSAAGQDEYGNVLYTELPYPSRCYMQPASQEEIQDGRAERGQFLVHLPPDVAGIIDGFARVDVAGVSYEAAGPPAIHPSLTSPDVHHVEVTVERGTA